MSNWLYEKYKDILLTESLSDLLKYKPKLIIEMVTDFREAMRFEFGLEDRDITYRSLNNIRSAFETGISVLVQHDRFADMHPCQTGIYHFLFGDWLLSNINSLVDRGYVKIEPGCCLATSFDTETRVNVRILGDTNVDISDEDFMLSSYSEIDQESIYDTNSSDYIFIYRVPDWIHPGLNQEGADDDDPSYFLNHVYIRFVESRKDFPDRDVILDIVKRWAYQMSIAPGIEMLTDINISDNLRDWVIAQSKGSNTGYQSVYNVRGVKDVTSGPLPRFNYEKTFTYGGESVTMRYRVFVSRNESLDLLAIKSIVSKKQGQH